MDYKQLDIFECFGQRYRIDKPIKMIELFAGIGSQAMCLKELAQEGLCEVTTHKVVEFDKYAIASYNAIHGTDFPVLDVTKIKGGDLEITNKIDNCYILTYSFP